MDRRRGSVVTLATLLIAVAVATSSAQRGAALTGVVTSQQEGTMEGVVVTARADAANVDVSVVSDDRGRYSFPGTHLKPGNYALKIRAVGYELAAPGRVDVTAGKTATADVKLQKAADMTQGQLTSVEWAMNLPGSKEQKDWMLKQTVSCGYCHSIERIVKSKYTAEQFPAVITRMQKYFLDGTLYGFEGRGRAVLENPERLARADTNPQWGYYPPLTKTDLGAYLATINMNGAGRNLPTTFKTLPRPKGVETKVIITQYDLPRKDTVAHDGDIDAQGHFWYTDQSAMYIGRFDTKTATFKEWAVPGVSTRKGPAGTSDIIIDKEGNVWFPATNDGIDANFGLVTKFNPKTETFSPVKNIPRTASNQFLGVDANGRLWTGAQGVDPWVKIDMKTATAEDFIPWIEEAKKQLPDLMHLGYQMEVDSKGNPIITDFSAGYIIKWDAAKKQIRPIKASDPGGVPRRGRMDKQDRFWFSLYRGDAIGMLDMRTETVTHYPMPFEYFTPYTSSAPDRLGRIYASSNTSDRLARVDTKTGQTIAYLMPTRDFDTKKIAFDPKDGKTVWFANKRGARIVKVEPLD